MGDELVSVVIPTFNYRPFVTAAVESVLAQTYRNFEIIVVDDGSTDHTDQALAPYAGRIRYIYQQNQGLSAARNTGISAARGRWIALLDSDDLWHPAKLGMQMGYLLRYRRVAALAAAMVTDLDQGWPAIDPQQAPAGDAITLEQLAIRSRFGPSSVIVRRDCFDKVGVFDPQLLACEDRDMWIRIAARFRIAKLRQPLWWYRLHEANMHRAVLRMEENELRMLDNALVNIRASGLRATVKQMAFGYAYYESAIRYAEVGMTWRSLAKLARSIVIWPIPYRAGEVRRPLERLRMLAVLLLKICHLRRVHPAPDNRTPSAPGFLAGLEPA